ncbi:MAG TPA: sorbosone dehydrogenase family protein [Candidatus Competibacter sp.]|nr:sorbosone dehydrogenase [Candidatus Competibacteraceae bacterium]HRC72844.1 sorbosone dehydrogenase family protein [Candidatus Competibacter sp.]
MFRSALLSASVVLSVLAGRSFAADPPLERIRLPPGFTVSVFADRVPNARVMVLGERGTLFVSTRDEGEVYALRDTDGDGRAETRRTIASHLNMPNGIAFRDGALYVAAVDRILRYDAIESRLDDPPEPVLITDALPKERAHGWRYIAFGPDGKLYVAVGAPCNICDEPGYAELRRLNADGSGMETVARGIRNTVGFTWNPQDRTLWFTDNGRDWLGDDRPPDELNHASRPGLHFGYPYCHGGELLDPDFGKGKNCADYTPPVQKLGPHVAALGLAFYTGAQFPERYRGQLFIAEHGSWNRSSKIGYRVSLVTLRDGRAVSYEPFAEGWLSGERAWGRPAYVSVMPDGSLLVSDDHAGMIYRIRYDRGRAPKT